MKKIWLKRIVYGLAALLVIGVWIWQTRQAPDDLTLAIQSQNGTHSFTIEIADTPESRENGLMERESLAPNHGMLFVFDEPRYINMWMKNTPLSLDMIFISDDGKINQIAAQTTPYSEDLIEGQHESLAVLEIRGGRASELGIQPGDHVEHEIFDDMLPLQ